MTEIAVRIVNMLAGDPSPMGADIEAVENWLLDGNDDGSSISDLADRFDMDIGLPSQKTQPLDK